MKKINLNEPGALGTRANGCPRDVSTSPLIDWVIAAVSFGFLSPLPITPISLNRTDPRLIEFLVKFCMGDFSEVKFVVGTPMEISVGGLFKEF